MCLIILCILQDNVAKTISAKKTTIARFNGIQQMWIGADYWPIEGKWKWRNAYQNFDGNIISHHFSYNKPLNELLIIY